MNTDNALASESPNPEPLVEQGVVSGNPNPEPITDAELTELSRLLFLAPVTDRVLAMFDRAIFRLRAAEATLSERVGAKPIAWLVRHRATGREEIIRKPLADLPFNRQRFEQFPLSLAEGAVG